jgi:hypothetical protein
MNPKTTKRLEALLATFDSGAVQPEELIRAIDAVMDVVKASQEAILSKVDTTDEATKKQLQELEADIASAFERIASQTKTLSTVSATKDEITALKKEVSAELARVSALIPELPDEFDATDIYQSIEAHKGLLDSLSTLIVGENIRNSLEALPEGEKLAIDAIENLREELDKRQAQSQTTALIARRLDQIGDVDIAGVTGGQVLAYNATTKLWEASSAGAGTGVVETIVAGTGISVDSTDPANPIVSASGGAGNPGGSDTQIQFNDGGAFGGAKLLYTEVGDVVQFTVTPQTVADTDGLTLDFESGRGLGSGFGGDLALNAGQGGETGDSGTVYLGGLGGGTTSGNGGSVVIEGGDAVIGDAGSITAIGGETLDGDGGYLQFEAGTGRGVGNKGGDVAFISGQGADSATHGDVVFQSQGEIRIASTADFNIGAILDADSILSTSKTFTFPNQSGTFALLSDISGGTGITRTVVTTSGNFTAGADISKDYVYFIAGAHTGTLPTAVGNTNRYTFKNNHSAAVTIDGDGTETIDGTANIQIAPEDSVDLISDNSNWRVI